MDLTLNTLKAAVIGIKRAQWSGEEATLVVNALTELVQYAETTYPPEDQDGDESRPAE
jgi:hypothetical protein